MTLPDTFRFAWRAASAWPLRTALMLFAMSIGVASVVMLTALGDGARAYVVNEFNSLGSNLVVVMPGRNETKGLSPGGFMADTPRDLTVEDAETLRRVPGVLRVAPLIFGTSEVAYGGKLREGMLLGTTASFIQVRRFAMLQGRFLASDDAGDSQAVAVIGAGMREALFGTGPVIGRMLRVGDRRFRIIGVLAPSGQGLGMNTDEFVVVPVQHALAMLNTNSLMRVMVEARNRDLLQPVQERVRAQIMLRHDGEEDVTVITQDAIVGTFDRILAVLTLGVAGIAAISLAVAGILVMNVMLVAVAQRTAEIGLMKALGASGAAIRNAFLTEAVMLSLGGACVGVALGYAGAWGLREAYPDLPACPPQWAVLAGLGTALLTGVFFGMLPARRAARLDPVDALARR